MTEVTLFAGGLLGLVAILFVAVHVYAYSFLWRSSRKLCSELSLQNRTLSRDEAMRRITHKEGMLIVDAPTLGWGIMRIWWSPRTDFSPRDAGPENDALASRADHENHSRFIDPSTGVACLVDGFVFSLGLKSYLKRHFHLDDCACIFTGGVLFDQELEHRRMDKT